MRDPTEDYRIDTDRPCPFDEATPNEVLLSQRRMHLQLFATA
jgi:hypothetical protein